MNIPQLRRNIRRLYRSAGQMNLYAAFCKRVDKERLASELAAIKALVLAIERTLSQ